MNLYRPIHINPAPASNNYTINNKRKRVGFLFNHYAAHQVLHGAPHAFELSRRHPHVDVIIAYSSNAERKLIRDIEKLYPGHRCVFKRLRPNWWYCLIDPIISKIALMGKDQILRDNLEFFRGLDAVVAPERHCRRLKTTYGLEQLTLIHIRHGAGDRKSFRDEHMLVFDFVLLPGRKYEERMNSEGYLRPGRFATVGYPKFEVVRAMKRARRRPFRNDKPIVVYNPHFDQSVGSYRRMGHQVLDFFADNPAYNLIFAPHVLMLKRHWRHRVSLPRRYYRVPNILIDTGGNASIDMSHILDADIYLGDVSSQVYEFLLQPRPCVFLNAHDISWHRDPHYGHWHFGPVVGDVAGQLASALADARLNQDRYQPIQQAAFEHTFYNDPMTTAAERGADAISGFLHGQSHDDVDALAS